MIAPLLPEKPRGVPRVDDRRVSSGIFCILRTAAPWRDLPERHGPRTLCNRCNRWAKPGLAAHLRGAGRDVAAVVAPDRQLDRPSPPARRRRKKRGEDHAIGRSRGGLSSRIHAVVERRGLPVRVVLAPARRPTRPRASEPVGPLALAGDVVADRGHFSSAVIAATEASGATARIPSQSNVRAVRTVDRTLCRRRNLVERFFNRLKHSRAIATRCGTLARNFLAAVLLASARL